jgi:type IV secretory pathway VirB10-like protein
MNTVKELFNKDRDLRVWWHTIVTDDRFELVCLHVRAAFMDSSPNKERIQGARDFEAMFKTISEADDTGQPLPGPGLNYMADEMPRKPEPATASPVVERPNENTDRPQSRRTKRGT